MNQSKNLLDHIRSILSSNFRLNQLFSNSSIDPSLIKKVAMSVVVVALAYTSFLICELYWGMRIWRHDSIYHTLERSWYENYNLRHEGRWINFYLWNLLAKIPPNLAAILSLLSLAGFGFLCANKLTQDRIISLIFGCALMFIPLFVMQNMWPNLTLAAVAMLPVFFFLSKKIHPFLLYALAGIYYFGTLSNFYFLIPLIFLSDLYKGGTDSWWQNFYLLAKRFLLPFILCFVIGFLISNGVVNALTGDYIQLPDWRQPNPISSFSDLKVNSDKIYTRLLVFIKNLYSDIHPILWIGALITVCLSLNRKVFIPFAVILVAFLSTFVTTIYHGIFISDRTLSVSVVALLAMLFIIPAVRFKHNLLVATLSLGMVFFYFNISSRQIKLFDATTKYYLENLELVPALYNLNHNQGIVVFAQEKDVMLINNQIKTHLDTNYKWGESLAELNRTVLSALKTMGYYNVAIVSDKNTIKSVKDQIQNAYSPSMFRSFTLPDQPEILYLLLNSTEVDASRIKHL